MSEPEQRLLRDKNEVELIDLMKRNERTSPVAKEAFGEFYRRHADGLKRHCLAKYRPILHCDDDVKEFVIEVFKEFWRHSIRLFDPAVAKKPEDVPKLVRYWLAKRAFWLSRKWARAAGVKVELASARGVDVEDLAKVGKSTVLDLLIAKEEQHQAVATRSSQLDQLDAGLSVLKQRERDVLLTCMQFYDVATSVCNVPPAVQEELQRDLRFNTWDAVRKCLERARRKLEQSVQNKARVA